MNLLQQLNSPFMYLVCGGIILFIAIVCIVFMVRAYRAGKAIGMDPVKLKRAISSSATFTVLPAVGILLGVIALSGSLGTPWPWLRLSVIGALHYETQVAQAGAEAVGMSSLSINEMTPKGFTTIALLMSTGIMWGMVLSIFFNRKYTQKIVSGPSDNKTKKGFGDYAMTAMFIGLVSAYIGSYIGSYVSDGGLFTFSGDWIPIAVAIISAIVMALFTYFSEKKHWEWLDGFSIAGSMLAGMLIAVVLGGM